MDYQLEKKITINRDTKHKNLYEWCLNEIDSDGKQQSRDLIPFRWGLYFTCYSLQVSTSINISKDSNADETKSVKNTSIYGRFYSGIYRDSENLSDDVEFSIFGTDRTIKDFSVEINLKTDDMQESCWLTSVPSYETEDANFRKYYEDDFIGFSINLSEDKFNELVNLIKSRAIDSIKLIVRNVSGIYSEWTPTITARSVKVLTVNNLIDGADVKDFEGTTASVVGDFDIQFITQSPLSIKPNLPKVEFTNEFSENSIQNPASSIKNTAYANSSNSNATTDSIKVLIELVGKVKTVLWCIFAALVLLLSK